MMFFTDATFLTALLSSGAALAGVAMQQTFSLLGKRAEHKRLLRQLHREKLEEFAEQLNAHRGHRLAVLDCYQRGRVDLESAKSVGKQLDQAALRLCALSLLYFPTIRETATEFLNASYGYQFALERMDEKAIQETAAALSRLTKSMENSVESLARDLH